MANIIYPILHIDLEKNLGSDTYRAYWPKHPEVQIGQTVVAVDSDNWYRTMAKVVHIDLGTPYVELM